MHNYEGNAKQYCSHTELSETGLDSFSEEQLNLENKLAFNQYWSNQSLILSIVSVIVTAIFLL